VYSGWRTDGAIRRVKFRDGERRKVTVVARWFLWHGGEWRPVVQLQWRAAGGTWTGSFFPGRRMARRMILERRQDRLRGTG
jgi:hypothetical protein